MLYSCFSTQWVKTWKPELKYKNNNHVSIFWKCGLRIKLYLQVDLDWCFTKRYNHFNRFWLLWLPKKTRIDWLITTIHKKTCNYVKYPKPASKSVYSLKTFLHDGRFVSLKYNLLHERVCYFLSWQQTLSICSKKVFAFCLSCIGLI